MPQTAVVENELASLHQKPAETLPAWTPLQRIAFRFFFLFVLQLILPWRGAWWKRLGVIRSVLEVFQSGLGLGASYLTVRGETGRWGLGSFASWGIAALIAAAGAGIWTWFARKSSRTEYNKLNYWTKLVVRYFVALVAITYGFYKVFPMQMPYPSISNLHTLLGDHAGYRLYWQGVGIVTWYEVFLGVMEVTSGALLLFRSTVAVGALANIVVMYNVTHGNFAYDGGVHMVSAELVLLSGLLFVPYAIELWKLLVARKDVEPYTYYPVIQKTWARYVYNGVRAAAIFALVPLYFFNTWDGYYNTNRSKEPRAPGLAQAAGYYNVTEFRLNGKEIPYSPLDPVRWQDAVFEDYPTFTYRVNHAWKIRLDNQSPMYKDAQKRYELAGFAGGRRYFHYSLDEGKQLLSVQDKIGVVGNPGVAGNESQGRSGGRNRNQGKGKAAKDAPVLAWHYERPSEGRIILSGKDENGNTLYAVLDRVDETWPIKIESPIEGQPVRYAQWERRYPVTRANFDGTEDIWSALPVSRAEP
jgi:hypothetical protein